MTKRATKRNADLKEILTERRRDLEDAVQRRIRDERSDRSNDVRDDVEVSDAGRQGDITFAVLQMRGETLRRVEEALGRLETGEYGRCAACEEEIAERRLRAMPFAVRCQACEEKVEQEAGDARELARRRSSFSLYSGGAGS
jgi:DnaK suppressor protein